MVTGMGRQIGGATKQTLRARLAAAVVVVVISGLGLVAATPNGAAQTEPAPGAFEAPALPPGMPTAEPAASPPVDEGSVKKAYPSEGAAGEEFRDVAGEMRCPTCTGLSVLESDTSFSRQIKDIVVEQVQAGKSKDEILTYFTDRYGPWILRSPPTQGFNILAWLVPIAILVLGPPAVWFFVWRRRRVISTFGVRSSTDIIEEMQRELAALRGSGKGGRV